MDYDRCFNEALAALHRERRYRVFATLERDAMRFPNAVWHGPHGPRDVTVWCSNDYLGMGRHPAVTDAMATTARRWAPGRAARAASPARRSWWSTWKRRWPACTAEAALVFTSGYISNETGIATLARLLPIA
jgi:5-aminolevulinate synthase